METLGTRLKNLRLDNRYTQRFIADSVGITVSALSQYENDKRTPKYDVLIQLADLFNVSSDYLLGHDNIADTEYSFEPVKQAKLASSAQYSYDTTIAPMEDSDLNSAKTRVLAAINNLPKQKQMEVLAVIELMLGTISAN